MKTISNWMIIFGLPVAAYSDWTNGELWPGAIIAILAWLSFVASQIIDNREASVAKEKFNPTH
jgi:hypothetical protein